jgi:TonB-dependent SusC/RagA subfamily outer membrane receptor
VIIDGLRKDFSDLMTMPLHFIDRIDILKSGGATAMYGFSGANGVISIITRTADRIDPYDLPKYSANFIINGYNEARIFYSPQHTNSSASGNGPDLRTTLFWKPDISLKTNQEFLMKYFNADNSSTICIVVEGITSDGIPVTGNTEYEVR